MPAVCLSGGMSAHCGQAGRMVDEVPDAGHYLAKGIRVGLWIGR
jgi:hypothetical protein